MKRTTTNKEKVQEPIEIKKVIRERGDISSAVRHNLSLCNLNRAENLPKYKDGGK